MVARVFWVVTRCFLRDLGWLGGLVWIFTDTSSDSLWYSDLYILCPYFSVSLLNFCIIIIIIIIIIFVSNCKGIFFKWSKI